MRRFKTHEAIDLDDDDIEFIVQQVIDLTDSLLLHASSERLFITAEGVGIPLRDHQS
jgi:hypothetical protein